MDPASIATTVVTFLAPYLAEGGKAAAKKIGEALVADPEFLAELVGLLGEVETEAPGAGYHAEVHGSGAIAQGPGAVAAGEGGLAVGGDVKGDISITGGRQKEGRKRK
jgi:hypothetical protein